MITKKEFFAILNDENNKIGVTAHIAVCEHEGFMPMLIIEQSKAPNTFLSSHRLESSLKSAFEKYNAWLNEWFEKRAAATEAGVAEAAHGEALAMDAAFMGDRCRDAVFFGSLDYTQRRIIVEAAHEEALTINEEMTVTSKADQKVIDADTAEIKAIRERVEAEHAEAAAVVSQPHGASIAAMKGRPVAYFTRAAQPFVEIIHPPVDGQRAQVDQHDVANVKEARAACITANAIPWNF